MATGKKVLFYALCDTCRLVWTVSLALEIKLHVQCFYILLA